MSCYGHVVRVLLFICVALAATGCARGDSGSDGAVVAAFYPLAWAAERVARDSAEVVNLTPPGAEPHDVELSPADVETVRDALLVVYVGGGFQPALGDAVESRHGRSLDLLDDEEEPHIWLDPVRFARAVAEIASALDGADESELLADLDALDAEYRGGLAECKREVVVTTHAAFGQLVRRYGLTELSLAGRSPEAEPSPRQLEELVDDVRASGATTVFAEPLVSDAVAETVAREAGVALATLDPVEGLSEERLEAGEDYLSVMRSNLAALREALGCL
jgi:zinc transport system substrate-binding protein